MLARNPSPCDLFARSSRSNHEIVPHWPVCHSDWSGSALGQSLGLPKASDLQRHLPLWASMKEFTSSHCLEAVLTLYSSKCLSSCSAQLSSPVLVIRRCIKHAPRSPPSHLDLVYLLFTTISTYTPLLFQLEFPSQSLGFQSLTAFSIAFMLSNLYNKRNLPPIFPNNSFHCNLASFNHVLQMSKLDWVRDSVQPRPANKSQLWPLPGSLRESTSHTELWGWTVSAVPVSLATKHRPSSG